MKDERTLRMVESLAQHREGLQQSLKSAIDARPLGAVAVAFGVGALLGTVGGRAVLSQALRGAFLFGVGPEDEGSS